MVGPALRAALWADESQTPGHRPSGRQKSSVVAHGRRAPASPEDALMQALEVRLLWTLPTGSVSSTCLRPGWF